MATRSQIARRDAALARSWLRTVRATFRREQKAVDQAIRDATPNLEIEMAVAALDTSLWVEAILSLWLGAALPIWDETQREVGIETDDDPEVTIAGYLAPIVEQKAAQIVAATERQLYDLAAAKGLKAEESILRRAAQRLYSRFRRDRAPRIAVTEALQAAAGVQHLAARASNLALTTAQATRRLDRMWNTVGDNVVRVGHIPAHGQVVGMNQPFSVDGESLMYPRDPAGSAGNIINCRCWETYIPRLVTVGRVR